MVLTKLRAFSVTLLSTLQQAGLCSQSPGFWNSLSLLLIASNLFPEVNLGTTSLHQPGLLALAHHWQQLKSQAGIPGRDWAWDGHRAFPGSSNHLPRNAPPPLPPLLPKIPALSPATPSSSTAISQVPRLNCRGCRHIYYLFLPCHLAFVYQKIISMSNRGKNISPCNSCRSRGRRKYIEKKLNPVGHMEDFFK